ncbi:MAG TPA: response regulator [Burkholderiales bacterium]|nr:response regulator [Burkholderiales bacterium]
MVDGSDPLRVYLVEDSALLRDRIIGSISEIDHVEVIGYADTEDDAVHEIRDAHPDVAIIDIRLREGSGINVVLAINRMQFTTAPKLVVLTNYSFEEYRDKCLAAGADFFFDKSDELHRVFELLENLAAPDSRH